MASHQLQSSWAFWYDQKQPFNNKLDSTSEFKDRLHKVCSFSTVEDFWLCYSYLKRPSSLNGNVNLYLFRDGLTPMWESFPRGGCWILKVKKKAGKAQSVLSMLWHDLVLSVIGEAFEEPDLAGISVSIRSKEDLISIWNIDNRNDEMRFKIGEKMKQILELEPATVIEYKHHAMSMQDMSTFRNAKAYVFAATEDR